MNRDHPSILLVMVPILLLGFIIGVSYINADIVWVDEIYSVSNMGAFDPPYAPLEIIESLVIHSPDHVPLYFILGSFWGRLVGWSQVPMRYLSLLFGALAIAWTYRAAADTLNDRAGKVAALLFATNGMILIYFHEIRMYTFLLTLAIIHIWLYLMLASRKSAGRWRWIAFVLTASAMAFTHASALFLLAGLGAFHTFFGRRSRRWRQIVQAWCLSALLFLPYVPLIALGFIEVANNPRIQSRAMAADELFIGLGNMVTNGVVALWIIIALCVLLTLHRGWQPVMTNIALILLFVLLAIFGLNAAFELVTPGRVRYFLISFPLFFLLISALLTGIPYWRLVFAVFFCLWIYGSFQVYQLAEHWQYNARNVLLMDHPPLQRYADQLQSKTRPHDTLLSFSRSGFINWPLRHGWSTGTYYAQVALGIDGVFVSSDLTDEDLRVDINRAVGSHPFLLFAFEPTDIPDNFDEVSRLIADDYSPCEKLVETDELFVQRLVLMPLTCDREYQPIHYENGIKIIDKFADYNPTTDTVRVVTGWEVADEAQLRQYNVSVQIITPDWQMMDQVDDHLHNDILKWHVVDLPTTDLPPGDYVAMVILYDRDTIKKVPGTDLQSGESSDIFPILRFTVDA